MQRRKFLATVGSLAAGSAAAMGTGAFESAEAERTVNVYVAGDESAWIKLSPESKYASINNDDALELSFEEHPDKDSGWGEGWSEGINPNATYEFTDVFSIWMDRAAGHGDYEYYFEKSGFDGVAVTIESGGPKEGNLGPEKGTDLTETWTQQGGPQSFTVDITLESAGGAGDASGSLILHADKLEE